MLRLFVNMNIFLCMLIAFQNIYAQNTYKTDTITAYEAAEKIGEEVIVRGRVVTIFFAEFSTGKPTFLNLEKPFPDNPIAIIIFEKELEHLGINARDYKGKNIIVKGTMEQYKDEAKPYKYKPSITIYNKDQLSISEDK